jgi:hypothetical protein
VGRVTEEVRSDAWSPIVPSPNPPSSAIPPTHPPSSAEAVSPGQADYSRPRASTESDGDELADVDSNQPGPMPNTQDFADRNPEIKEYASHTSLTALSLH